MKKLFEQKALPRTVGQYIAAVCLCLLILGFVLKLGRAHFTVPFHYGGDALLHSMFIKGMVDNGWYWQNKFLGMPYGLEMYDFPAVDNFQFLVIFVISRFTSNTSLILNLFYLLTFPLVTISSLFVFRKLRLSYLPSLCGSLLYTFLPYHFMRGESHLFLSAYYLLPISILIVLWVGMETPFCDDGPGEVRKIQFRNHRFIASLVFAGLMGLSGAYYPFMFCFFLLTAGAFSAFRHKRARPLFLAGAFIAATSTVFVVNSAPTLLYFHKHGDVQVTKRHPAEAEVFGLKIAQLLLPITGHRIPFLATIKDQYNQAPLVNENDTASLGLIGSAGFLLLLLQLFRPTPLFRKPEISEKILIELSVLNILAVLLATIGGFASLFALFISSRLRSYDRISVFIAFFSFLVGVVILERVRGYFVSFKGRVLFALLLMCVIVVGVFDQTSANYIPEYKNVKSTFDSDAQFVAAIESTVPANAMIFQLPYVPFPEHPPVNKMTDYDHFRGYLHSRALRWSYGAMKSRQGDQWQKTMAALPLKDFVTRLAFAGFGGIYIDRFGYSDNGASLESELFLLIGAKPLESANKRLAFFDIAGFSSHLRQGFSAEDWQSRQDLTLHPLSLTWAGGFSDLEQTPEKNWRWCAAEGSLYFDNPSQRTRKIEIQMYLATGHSQLSDLRLSGLISDEIKINSTPTYYSRTISVPPGRHLEKFQCNAPRVDAPLDPRHLVFRIENFRLEEFE